MKKVLYFFLLFLAAMGIVGGIGYTIYAGVYPIAVGIAISGWMAYPKFKEYFCKLIG